MLFQFSGSRFYLVHVCFSGDVKQNCLTSKSSFHGCLRNLVLTRGQQAELFDFSRAFDLRGVFPHSCPGAQQWSEQSPSGLESIFLFISCISFSFHSGKIFFFTFFFVRACISLIFWLFFNSGHLFFFFSQNLYVCILTRIFSKQRIPLLQYLVALIGYFSFGNFY